LSHDQVAAQSGLPLGASSIWDIEECERDMSNNSPAEVRKFCHVLGIRPAELFGESPDPPVLAPELVSLIRKECASRRLTLEQFEDIVGWRLSACIEPPERLLEDISIDGLQWLCNELRIDWRSAL
jgi:hypothetical protein